MYKNGSEEDWFTTDNPSNGKIDTDKIVDFALSVSELSKPLKDAYNHLIKINKKLGKDNMINSEVINVISTYFTKAMSSIRNLSYSCIKVCTSVLKKNKVDLTKIISERPDDELVVDTLDISDISSWSKRNLTKCPNAKTIVFKMTKEDKEKSYFENLDKGIAIVQSIMNKDTKEVYLTRIILCNSMSDKLKKLMDGNNDKFELN